MARQGKQRKRGRFVVLGLLAATVAAVTAYRQRELARHRVEFDEVYR